MKRKEVSNQITEEFSILENSKEISEFDICSESENKSINPRSTANEFEDLSHAFRVNSNYFVKDTFDNFEEIDQEDCAQNNNSTSSNLDLYNLKWDKYNRDIEANNNESTFDVIDIKTENIPTLNSKNGIVQKFTGKVLGGITNLQYYLNDAGVMSMVGIKKLEFNDKKECVCLFSENYLSFRKNKFMADFKKLILINKL